MKEPSFFCIGFQKCGTTTLFEILRQHKGIALCRDVKEPMYYRVKGLRAVGGKQYYLQRYFGHLSASDQRMVGEVNAGLSYTDCAKKLSKDFAPDTKLIFMMRNPVDRAYSAYKYFLARGFLPDYVVRDDKKNGHARAFHHYVHAILDNPEDRKDIMKKRLKYLVFSQSNYAVCIEEYLEHFPRENIKLVFFEEFIHDQKTACEDIFHFLGVDNDASIDYQVKANEGNERPVSPAGVKMAMCAKIGRYALYEFLGMSHWAPKISAQYQRFYEFVRSKGMQEDWDKSKMLPQTRVYLENYFRDEVRRMEVLSERSLATLWFA
ncbi:MAG: sulfotransferase domain-containing protein [Clostridia bacterium]|nr:sulfotransferase domain-containing protein [Clostridia bacterium]